MILCWHALPPYLDCGIWYDFLLWVTYSLTPPVVSPGETCSFCCVLGALGPFSGGALAVWGSEMTLLLAMPNLSAELTSPLGNPSRIRLVGGRTTRTKTTSGWHRLLQQHGKEALHSVSELPPCGLSLSGSCPHFHGEHISLLPHSYTANLKS